MLKKSSLKMALAPLVCVMLLLSVAVSGFRTGNALSMNYYMMSCPFAQQIVQNTVAKALQNDPTLGGPLLRMFFHDCFIEGCDGSILLDSTKDNTAEKDSPANLSLRGYEVIDEAKEEIEKQCPGVVSCADIVVMVASHVVFMSRGPFTPLLMGRKDGTVSNIRATINLPAPTFNASQLINIFGQRGFNSREVVALSGAHTLGVARCSSFKQRLTSVDPTLDSEFSKELVNTCSAGDNAEQPLDATRNSFDNSYFNALVRNEGVLFSDQALLVSPETRAIVQGYAWNQAMFFFDFQQAMAKMSMLDVKDSSKGEVRKNCRKVN